MNCFLTLSLNPLKHDILMGKSYFFLTELAMIGLCFQSIAMETRLKYRITVFPQCEILKCSTIGLFSFVQCITDVLIMVEKSTCPGVTFYFCLNDVKHTFYFLFIM